METNDSRIIKRVEDLEPEVNEAYEEFLKLQKKGDAVSDLINEVSESNKSTGSTGLSPEGKILASKLSDYMTKDNFKMPGGVAVGDDPEFDLDKYLDNLDKEDEDDLVTDAIDKYTTNFKTESVIE